MQGHIRKRPSRDRQGRPKNLWYVVIDIGRDANGKRRQKWHGSYPTRKAAEAARARIVTAVHTGTYVEPRGLSCEDVRRVRDDTDALEALVVGPRPGLMVPSTMEDLAVAGHRSARLAPRDGSEGQFGLEWHRLELLTLALADDRRSDRSSRTADLLDVAVAELRTELIEVQTAPRSLGYLVTALAPLGEPTDPARATDAVEMRANGRRLAGIVAHVPSRRSAVRRMAGAARSVRAHRTLGEALHPVDAGGLGHRIGQTDRAAHRRSSGRRSGPPGARGDATAMRAPGLDRPTPTGIETMKPGFELAAPGSTDTPGVHNAPNQHDPDKETT